MTGNSTTAALATIRETVSLSSIVARSVKLRRVGREWKGCCPFHPDRSPSFTIYADDRRFCCFGCGAEGDQADFVQRARGVGLVEAIRMIDGGSLPVVSRQHIAEQADDRPARTAEAAAIWQSSARADGTPAATYLASRGLGGPVPPVLRFSRLRYGARGDLHHVMVGLIVDEAGQPQGIQRTYLNANGTGKLDVEKPKLSLGRVKGGAIRLAQAHGEVTLTEGIEDALALMHLGAPAAWAAAGSSMMHSVALPAEVQTVVIGGDRDDTGRKAAERAALAFSQQGRRTRIIYSKRARPASSIEPTGRCSRPRRRRTRSSAA